VAAKDTDVERLIKELWDEDKDNAFRISAAEALGDIGAQRAASGADAARFTEVERALLKITGGRSAPHAVQYSAYKAIKKIQNARIDAVDDPAGKLIEFLSSGDADPFRTVEALVKIGAPAVGPLCKALGDPWSGRSANAARALGRIGDPSAVDSLCKALGHKEPDVRASAANALLKIGDARGVEAIYTTLENGMGDSRIEAAEAVGQIGGTRAIEALCKALGDVDWRVASCAAKALVKIGAPAARALCKALGDPNRVRNDGNGVHTRTDAAESLVKIGEPAVKALHEALADGDSDVRRCVAEALKRIGVPAPPQ
jgi:HEAT repeat protein